jgi:hypothetical protein
VGIASLLWALRVELAVDGVTSVEFAPPGSHPGDEAPLATITLKAPCDPAALELTIEIDDVATEKTLERRVSVADVPPTARARAVAIGAAELLVPVGPSLLFRSTLPLQSRRRRTFSGAPWRCISRVPRRSPRCNPMR